MGATANTLKRAKLSVSIGKRWVKLRHLIKKSKLTTLKIKWKKKKEQGEANRKQMVLVVMILIQGATLVNWIPSFLGIPIPRNSWKLPIMQIALANWIPSFLGIPRNSKEFPTMQISPDLKSLELVHINSKKFSIP